MAIRRQNRKIPDALIGVGLLIFSEVMFFAGLVSAYFISRATLGAWPPLGQIRLPVLLTGVNTIIFLGSGYYAWQARRTYLSGHFQKSGRILTASLGLGGLFLILQGSEWVRLIGFGLDAKASVYGAFFYLIIGAHGCHVVAGLLALLMSRRIVGARSHAGSDKFYAIVLFWEFVVLLWPLLYLIVYVI